MVKKFTANFFSRKLSRMGKFVGVALENLLVVPVKYLLFVTITGSLLLHNHEPNDSKLNIKNGVHM